jgi:hypothetical protein
MSSQIVARRLIQLTGEATESHYEEGRYYVGGQVVDESLDVIQRDVFAFVADQDKRVTVAFSVEVGPEFDLDLVETSGIQRFVAILPSNQVKRNVKTKSFAFTGEVMEYSPGSFYVVDGKEQNFNAAAKRAVSEALDKYASNNESVTVNISITVSEEAKEIVTV